MEYSAKVLEPVSYTHLSFDTADGKVDALKDVSITIEDGDIYGCLLYTSRCV